MSADLQTVADRQAITDLIYRYCRAMDRMDAELGYSIWHADGVAEYEGVFTGTGRSFIDFVNEQHRQTLMHTHQVTNVIIELDGDRAASEAYFTSTLRIGRGDQIKQIEAWGRYIDQWSRRNGRWGIDKRVSLRDFDSMRDVTPMSQSALSKRDRSDPSYTVLRG